MQGASPAASPGLSSELGGKQANLKKRKREKKVLLQIHNAIKQLIPPFSKSETLSIVLFSGTAPAGEVKVKC